MSTCGRGCQPDWSVEQCCELRKPMKNTTRQFYKCPQRKRGFYHYVDNTHRLFRMVCWLDFSFIHYTRFSEKEKLQIVKYIVKNMYTEPVRNIDKLLKRIKIESFDNYNFEWLKKYTFLTEDEGFYVISHLLDTCKITTPHNETHNETCVVCLSEGVECLSNIYTCSCKFELCTSCEKSIHKCLYCSNSNLKPADQKPEVKISDERIKALSLAIDYFFIEKEYVLNDDYEVISNGCEYRVKFKDDGVVILLYIFSEEEEFEFFKEKFSDSLCNFDAEFIQKESKIPVSLDCIKEYQKSESNELIKDLVNYDHFIKSAIENSDLIFECDIFDMYKYTNDGTMLKVYYVS